MPFSRAPCGRAPMERIARRDMAPIDGTESQSKHLRNEINQNTQGPIRPHRLFENGNFREKWGTIR